MNPPKRPRKRPKATYAVDLLRELISTGELPAGQHLMEEELAELTGTSRTPVREALHLLEKEKLVVRRSRGGYEVRPVTHREIQEVAGVRAVLESYAIKLASRRISLEFLDRMEANIRDFEAAIEEDQRQELVALNEDFHGMLYQAADSRVLTQMLNELSQVTYRLRVITLYDQQGARLALRDHRRIFRALKKGEIEEAARLGGEHLLTGGRMMQDLISRKSQEPTD